MKRAKLVDSIDQRILEIVQTEGRITNLELSRRVGLSGPPCIRRVRALERAGYIKGYRAEISPQAIGYDILTYISVTLVSHADVDLRAFEILVEQWTQVFECYRIAGGSDFLLKVASEDWKGYQRFLSSTLTAAPNVARIHSMPVAGEVKGGVIALPQTIGNS